MKYIKSYSEYMKENFTDINNGFISAKFEEETPVFSDHDVQIKKSTKNSLKPIKTPSIPVEKIRKQIG